MRFEASFQTIERCQEHPRTRMVPACYSCLGHTQWLRRSFLRKYASAWAGHSTLWVPWHRFACLHIMFNLIIIWSNDIQWYPMGSLFIFVYLCFRFFISNVSGNEHPKISQVVVGPCPKYSRHEPNFLKKLLKGVGAAEISTFLAYVGCISLQWLKCLLWKFSSGFLLGPLFEM